MIPRSGVRVRPVEWYPLWRCAVLKDRRDSGRSKGSSRTLVWVPRQGDSSRIDSSFGVRPEPVSRLFPVATARGKHLFPFRTEQLSPSAPMVLGSQGPGRVGRRRFFHEVHEVQDTGRLRAVRGRSWDGANVAGAGYASFSSSHCARNGSLIQASPSPRPITSVFSRAPRARCTLDAPPSA